jgi:myo-inositol 2-dehydrogenase / D-chiro-inositol 1-dehydrogenase
VRVAVIGAGWIAADHLGVLASRADVEVAAVCDLDRARAEQLAPEGAAVYEQWEELLERERPEAVWICTPPLVHRDPAVAALERGIHVYLEKPIARTLDDAEVIVAAASASAAVCAVGYQWHAVEVLDDLRAALEGQRIALLVGRSIGPTGSRPWFLDRAKGGGNVLERGSHQIDLVRTVAGEVASVQAAAGSVLLGQAEGAAGDIEDAATLVLHLASGALATISVAWTREGQPGSYGLDVVAEEATLAVTLDPEFSLSGRSRGDEVHAKSSQHPFERTIDRFLASARSGDRDGVFCTPADAARTLAVARACEEALASGATVAL